MTRLRCRPRMKSGLDLGDAGLQLAVQKSRFLASLGMTGPLTDDIMKRLLLLSALCAACTSGSQGPTAPRLVTGLPRQLSANEARVAGAANQFSLSLFRRLSAAQP